MKERIQYCRRPDLTQTGATTNEAAERRRQHLCSALVWTIFLILPGLVTFFAPAAPAQVLFDRYEIDTGPATKQTVVPGFFLGGRFADLAVVNVAENGRRRLRLYTFDQTGWTPKFDVKLNAEAAFVDKIGIGGRDRLLIYAPEKLSWFDPEQAAERELAPVAARFNPSEDGAVVPRVNIARDVTGDGLDDLVVPHPDGFQVFVQLGGDRFAEPVKLGPSEPFLAKTPFGAERTYGEIGWTARTNLFYQNRVHEMDYNRDGRRDLAFWDQGHFEVYLQNERGLFDPPAATLKTAAKIDFDGIYSVFFRTGREKRWSLLHSVSDLNGDGIADLLISSQKSIVSRGSHNRRRLFRGTRYEVHFGRTAPDGRISFAAKADTTIRAAGFIVGVHPDDLDRDGRAELLMTGFKLGIFSFFRIAVARKIPFTLRAYRMERGAYPDKPNAVRKFTAAMDAFDDRQESFYPFILTGDVTGDGRADLLLARDRQEMHIFAGVPGPELFARKAQKVRTAIPIDEQYTRLADLNGDDRQDIIMRHPPATDGGTHRVSVLIVR